MHPKGLLKHPVSVRLELPDNGQLQLASSECGRKLLLVLVPPGCGPQHLSQQVDVFLVLFRLGRFGLQSGTLGSLEGTLSTQGLKALQPLLDRR